MSNPLIHKNYPLMTEEQFINFCKMVEIYIQNSEDYRASIGLGYFSTRFFQLWKAFTTQTKPIPRQPELEHQRIMEYWDKIRKDKPELYDEIAKYGITSEPEQQADGGEYGKEFITSVLDKIPDDLSSRYAEDNSWNIEEMDLAIKIAAQQAVQQERERVEQLQKEKELWKNRAEFMRAARDCHEKDIVKLQSELEQTKARKVKWPEKMIAGTCTAIGWNECINEFKRLNPEVE